MQLVFYIAIASAILRWTQNFVTKVVSEKGYNVSHILLLNSFFFVIFWTICSLIIGWEILDVRFFIFLAFLHAILYFFWNYCKYFWQKYVPSYMFYSIGRLRSIFLIFIWYFLFQESITLPQVIGIILTFIWTLFILQKDTNFKKWTNLNLGILFSIWSLLFYTASISSFKMWLETGSIFYFILFTHLFTVSVAKWTQLVEKWDDKVYEKFSKFDYLKISLILSALLFCADVTYAYSLKNLNIAVVSSLISVIAITIPIVLSAIFYKEKLSKKKIFALVLILFSVYLLSMK